MPYNKIFRAIATCNRQTLRGLVRQTGTVKPPQDSVPASPRGRTSGIHSHPWNRTGTAPHSHPPPKRLTLGLQQQLLKTPPERDSGCRRNLHTQELKARSSRQPCDSLHAFLYFLCLQRKHYLWHTLHHFPSANTLVMTQHITGRCTILEGAQEGNFSSAAAR